MGHAFLKIKAGFLKIKAGFLKMSDKK